MIVEFISTPGAGKTTLLASAAEYWNAGGYQARHVNDAARPLAARTGMGRAVNALAPLSWRRPLLWQVFYLHARADRLRYLALNPGLMAQVWRFQRRRPISHADRRHVLRWFNHQAGVYEFARRQAAPGEIILFDEGFIHRVVQLFASEFEDPAPADVEAYIARIPRPDLVIHPVAPLGECERRVYERGLWDRFAAKSAGDTSRYLAAAERAVAIAVRAIRDRGWAVVEIDNSGAPATAAAQLRRALAGFTPAASVAAGSQPLLS